jgi:hypothetical protein
MNVISNAITLQLRFQEVLDMDPILWDISDRARAAWRKAAVPRGSQFFNIFGTGFQTAYDVQYGSLEAPIVSPSDITSSNPVRRFTWIDGDSTVPLCCAVSGAHCEILHACTQGFFTGPCTGQT